MEHRAFVKRFVSLLFLHLDSLDGGVDPSQGRYLAQTQNKHRQTSMPRVEFEPTIPVFERAKTFHAIELGTQSAVSNRRETRLSRTRCLDEPVAEKGPEYIQNH
jgi:hypothetical protein